MSYAQVHDYVGLTGLPRKRVSWKLTGWRWTRCLCPVGLTTVSVSARGCPRHLWKPKEFWRCGFFGGIKTLKEGASMRRCWISCSHRRRAVSVQRIPAFSWRVHSACKYGTFPPLRPSTKAGHIAIRRCQTLFRISLGMMCVQHPWFLSAKVLAYW